MKLMFAINEFQYIVVLTLERRLDFYLINGFCLDFDKILLLELIVSDGS